MNDRSGTLDGNVDLMSRRLHRSTLAIGSMGCLLGGRAQQAIAKPRKVEPESVGRLAAVGGGRTGATVVVEEAVARPALPETFFGFSLNFFAFAFNHMRDGVVREDVLSYLRAMPGAVYRFPGGLESNHHDWEGALGPYDQRRVRRDFDWRYKGRPGVSRAEDFARLVMQALPMAEDFSLNTYYDTSRESRRTDVASTVGEVRKVINYVKMATGRRPGLRITEHGRQLPEDRNSGRTIDTSGIDGAISVADYVLAMEPTSEVRGLFVQALDGTKWAIFVPNGSRMEPTPVYWILRVLNDTIDGRLLVVKAESSNASGYEGGYDTRVVAFKSADDSALALWAVNRSWEDLPFKIVHKPYSGKSVTATLAFVKSTSPSPGSGPTFESARSLDHHASTQRFDVDGELSTSLPPRSICVLRFKAVA